MTEDIDLVSERQAKQRHLASLEVFLGSDAYVGYVAARTEDITNLESAILLTEPVDRVTEIEGFKLRGELRCQQEMLEVFSDARNTLKQRIDEMVERENQNA